MRIPFLLLMSLLTSQANGHTIKDKTGVCQLSVPANWTVLSTPGHAASPDHMDTTVISGLRAYKPFSEGTLKTLRPDTVFENSASRSFYMTKSSDGKTVAYHIEVPGSGNACIAQITAAPTTPQDEIKKIALTLSPVK